MDTHKALMVFNENTYKKLIKNGRLDATRNSSIYDLHKFGKAHKWLLAKYKERTGLNVPGLFNSDRLSWATKSIDELAEHYMADCKWVLIEFEVPKDLCIITDQSAEWHLSSYHAISYTEQESDIFISKWDKELKNSGAKYPDILYVDSSNKGLVKLRNAYLNDVMSTWDRIFDLDAEVDENWCGKKIPTTWFPYICSNWITKSTTFRGTDWKDWIGPNKVDPENYPMLAGYGDDLKIGDSFTIKNEIRASEEFYTLCGWSARNTANNIYVSIFAKNNKGDFCSFCANPQGGDRVFVKKTL